MWKEKFKEYFDFNRSQRNGVVVLAGMVVLLVGMNFILPWLFPSRVIDYSSISEKVDEWNSQQANNPAAVSPEDPDQGELLIAEKTKHGLFPFNPNHLPVEQWQQLGFSLKQAEAIIRYEEKGGQFRIKSDVAKLFVVSPEKFEELQPYIQLPDSLQKAAYSKREESTSGVAPAPMTVELNTADTNELKKLKGIGSYYARKIAEYRDNLGGYLSPDQLLEIWKMKPETVEAIRPFVHCDPALALGVAVNSSDVERLKKHPYLTPVQASTLVAYREKHGPFATPEQIQKATLMTDDEFKKFRPYIRLE